MTDPDRMSPRDLRRLPGIGERRALAIAGARWEQGLAGGPDSWDRIPGIGPETVRRIRAWLDQVRRGETGRVIPTARSSTREN